MTITDSKMLAEIRGKIITIAEKVLAILDRV